MLKRRLKSMLLPLSECTLMVPRTLIVEVIAYQTPKRQEPEVNWFAGLLSWRGVEVPIVRLECMDKPEKYRMGPKPNIAIISVLLPGSACDFMGIILQNYPRLEQVNAGNFSQLSKINSLPYSHKFEYKNNEYCLLDIDKIQKKVLTHIQDLS